METIQTLQNKYGGIWVQSYNDPVINMIMPGAPIANHTCPYPEHIIVAYFKKLNKFTEYHEDDMDLSDLEIKKLIKIKTKLAAFH